MSTKTIAAVAGAFVLLICMHVPPGHVTSGQAGWMPRTVTPVLRTEPAVPAAPVAAAPSIPETRVAIAQPGPAEVAGVSIGSAEGGAAVIEIKTTQPVQFKPFMLHRPDRLVIDLQDAEARRTERIAPAQPGALKDVRVAQFSVSPSRVVRVVADLATERPFEIQAQPSGVRVRIDHDSIPTVSRRSTAVPAAIASRSAGRMPALPRVAQTSISGVCGISRSCESKTADLKSAVPRYSSPETSAAPKLVAAVMAPEFPPAVPRSVEPVALETGPDGELSGQTGGIVSTPFYARQKYTGKLISLDLRDVDIRDFFRLIHQVSGLNIVVDSDVTGKITMVMDDVPWDQALAIALKDNGLATRLEGGVLRVAKVSTLLDEAKAQAEARAVKLDAEPLVTVVRQLQYARAADLLPGQAGAMTAPGGGAPVTIPGVVTILNGLKGVISPDGKVVADPRDNAVIITDHRSQIPIIEAVIDKLDMKSKQISIQVRVILANVNFVRSLSSALTGATLSRSGNVVSGGSTGTGASVQPNVPFQVTPPPRLTIGQTLASGFGAYAISSQSARYAINAAIAAAEEHDQARTISRPTIVTQNNVRGEVQQGVQIPIQTDINNTIAVQYVNATLQLSVTPQVTVDGKVFLNIFVNNASVGTLSTIVGPSINTQEATTQVLVPNGGTVVFGGITVSTRARSATYIPLLGNIPVLGNLFKSSQVSDQNQELLFFVSPTILPG